MSILEVSVAAGDFGPVIVLAGEADLSSIAQLNEVLTTQVSARTSHLTIDVTNLRSVDLATAQALILAALIIRVQGGNAVLLNPRATVALMLDRLRAAETFTVLGRASAGTNQRTAPTLAERRPALMTNHESDVTISLRRQPASPDVGNPEDTVAYEVICRYCGDDPALDHQEVPAGLRRIRGPHPIKKGIAKFLEHNKLHGRTDT